MIKVTYDLDLRSPQPATQPVATIFAALRRDSQLSSERPVALEYCNKYTR